MGRQDDTGGFAIVDIEYKPGLKCRAGVKHERQDIGGARDAEQLSTVSIAYAAQKRICAKSHVLECDTVSLRGEHLHRHGDFALPHFKYFYQPGLVIDTVTLVAQLIKMKGVDFFLRNSEFSPVQTDLHSKGFTRVQR